MNSTLATIKNILQTFPDLELSILIGSQAKKCAKPESDWDIALRWSKNVDALHAHQQTEIKLPPAKPGVYWVSPSKGLTKP